MPEKLELLTPDKCCLMVVDPQERLMDAIHKPERLIRNGSLLIRCARELNMPILATTQYRKGLGPLVPELAAMLADVPQLDKIEFDAMANARVRKAFDALPRRLETVLLTGAEAHICIFQTAIGIKRYGWHPWVVADGVSSRDKQHVRLTLDRLRNLGISVGPTEMAVYELLHHAGGSAFKAMLPYLK
jgi:nicotinamidase-related amidase